MAKRLLILAHAPSPNTLAMRDSIREGARHPTIQGVKVVVKAPLDAVPEDVLNSNALIIGTTENLGYMSGALKDFFDRSYYPLIDKTEGFPYALCIRAGLDGTGTRRSVESIATGLKWRAVQAPLLCRGEYNDGFLMDCKKLGMAMSAGLETGIF